MTPIDPGYAIAFEEDSGILCLTFQGFWTQEILERFSAEVIKKVTAIRAARSNFNVLVDQTQFDVQTASISHGLNTVLEAGAKMNSGYAAVAAGGVLNKLQVERNVRNPRTRTFLRVAEARGWLIAQPPMP